MHNALSMNFPRAHSYPVRALIFLACLLLAFTLADYLAAGSLRIGKARLEKDNSIPLAIQLPFRVTPDAAAQDLTYRLSFLLPDNIINRLYPLELTVAGCISSISVNGMLAKLPALPPGAPCRKADRMPLESLLPAAHSGDQLEVVFTAKRQEAAGLDIRRGSLRTPFQQCVLLMLAAYLLSLSFVRDEKKFTLLHRNWALGLCFAIPLTHNYDFAGLQWAASYLANGLAVAFLAFLFAWCEPGQQFYRVLDRLLEWIMRLRPRYFIPCCMALFFLIAAAMSQLLFDGIPHIADSHVQYMHSKILAEGRLYDESHPLRQYFQFQNAMNNGKYFGITFPGHPALLALAQKLGLPWLLNPLMGALTVGAVFLLARELGGIQAGFTAAALTTVSPYLYFMSSEYMNHASCMFFLTLFLYAYIRYCKTGSWRFALLAGSAAGFALLIRVQAAVPFALPVGMHAAWRFLRLREARNASFFTLVLSFAAFALMLLWYNALTTGDPWRPAYMYYPVNEQMAQFGPQRWARLPGDFFRLLWQIKLIHLELFYWPTSSLWLVFLLVLCGRLPPFTFLLFLSFAGQLAALALVFPDAGTVMLPRYIYESNGLLIVLSALGLRAVVQKIRLFSFGSPFYPCVRASAALALAMLVALAIPYRGVEMWRIFGTDYWEGNASYDYMISHSVETPALVFVSPYSAYRLLYFHQPPRDDSPIIYALDLRKNYQPLMNHYPQRHVYVAQWWDVRKIR